MNKWQFLCGILIFMLLLDTASAATVPLRGDTPSETPQTEILYQDAERLQFEVKIPAVVFSEATLEGHHYDRVEIPGGGYHSEIGAPEVPNFTRLIALPPRSGVKVHIELLESRTFTNIDLIPAQGDDPADLAALQKSIHYNSTVFNSHEFYPATDYRVGEPAIMRGVRLVPLQINPVRYNAVSQELQVAHRIRVDVLFEGQDLRNVPENTNRPMSRSWANLLSASILNFDTSQLDIVPTGSYLFVCENDSNLVNTLLAPLMDWKRRKGHTVDLLTFTPGSSNTAIKALIQSYYDAAEIPPEFVLLIGDTDGTYALPGWDIGYWPSDETDHVYAQLEGDDILADVAIGRIPADDAVEVITMSNKVLWYEKMPYTYSDEWYGKGCVIAGNSYSGISTVQTNRYIKTRMLEHEFTQVDTFWYWMSGSVATTTTTSINNGISCYNYRGNGYMENFSVSQISSLTNGFKMPFVVTITCGTGGFAGSESFMERFCNVGSPISPQGAIAAVGTATLETHTRQNNTIAYGLWSGMFDEDITQAGNALNRGKLELYNTFQANDPGSVTNFSNYAALAGDPGIEIYCGPIQYMTSTIPASINWGENTLSLTVDHTGVGPLEDALVCLYRDAELQEVGLTDANGQVSLPVNVNSPGNVKVTITKHNFAPIVDSLDVVQAGVVVGYYDHMIDDDQSGSSNGDADGAINPGEQVEIPLTFKNYGSSTTATNISVTATLVDEYVTLVDSAETFPNLMVGGTASSNDDLDLLIDADCPHGHVVHLDLEISADQGSWEGSLDLLVVSSQLDIAAAYQPTGESFLQPGSTNDLVLRVANNGDKNAVALTASLTSLEYFIQVEDNSSLFGDIEAGSRATSMNDPFSVTVDPYVAPGYTGHLLVTFVTESGAIELDTISMALGEKTETDPQGPDSYGYYCYDNTDGDYADVPIYDWFEIDPAQGGPGTQLSINDPSENQDDSVIQRLPFVFQYYGQSVEDITICSNGWIAAIADESYTDFRNYPIPSCVGPRGMMAAFWDNLSTWTEGHVFAYYDEENHRFIIEWSRLKNYNPWGYEPEETFQIILFDPAYYTTPTGDGEILFQYEHIEDVQGYYMDVPFCTVGIENFEQDDGIEVVYWNTYEEPAAGQLQNRRAYLFTTNFDYLPWLQVDEPEADNPDQIIPQSFDLQDAYPNPFNPVATLGFALPRAARVNLTIYNVQGQVVDELVDGYYPAGNHQVVFHASNLASGVYFYRVEAGEFSALKKMVLMK